MNTTEQSEVYQTLYDRRQEIAQAWFEALEQLTPVAIENAKLLTQLETHSERLIEILVSDPFDAAAAQQIGAALDAVDNLQPDAVGTLQRRLAQQLTQGLSDAQIVRLYPRLVETLSAMTTGFFIGKANRAKTFNMSAMSRMGHDLKTPINAVTGFSRVILKGIDGPITEFQQQDLTSIFEAGRKLLTMIDDTFEVAKSDAAKTKMFTPPFDVSALLGDVMQTAQPMLAKRGHTLEVQGVGDLGTMRTDASRVRWILLALLLHASRLAEKRKISLITMREKVQDVDYFVFEIAVMLPSREGDEDAEEMTEADIQGDEDVGLMTATRFCDDLGGNLVTAHTEDGIVKFTVQLPAR
jgi:signal transduction histidine kinase